VPLVATRFLRDPTTDRLHEHAFRIGYADRCGAGPVDIYYPYADVGFLWFRKEGGLWCVSGMLKRKLFADQDRANALTAWCAEQLGIDEQVAACIELVDAVACVVENGEESLLLNGDGEQGARFTR
jgi:hypothetical protein